MTPAYDEKNRTSDARYPISQRAVPSTAVSLINCFILDVFRFAFLCFALRGIGEVKCDAIENLMKNLKD